MLPSLSLLHICSCRKSANNVQVTGGVGDSSNGPDIYEYISPDAPYTKIPRTFLPPAQPSSENPDGEYCAYGQIDVAVGEPVRTGPEMGPGAVMAPRPCRSRRARRVGSRCRSVRSARKLCRAPSLVIRVQNI